MMLTDSLAVEEATKHSPNMYRKNRSSSGNMSQICSMMKFCCHCGAVAKNIVES